MIGLTDRVRIEQRGSGVDDIGQPIEVWVEVITVWAQVKFLRGLESARSNSESSTILGSIRTRKRTGISPAMRVTYGGVIYNIVAVLPQLNSMMDLTIERTT